MAGNPLFFKTLWCFFVFWRLLCSGVYLCSRADSKMETAFNVVVLENGLLTSEIQELKAENQELKEEVKDPKK
ncbi:MAG: hypothetical protein Alis3KO_40970 [Aliiglaciecola sp.]